MPRQAACVSCHQRKVKCFFHPGSTQCSSCACNGTRCVPFASSQGQRSDLPAKRKLVAHRYSNKALQLDNRSPVLMQQNPTSDVDGTNDGENRQSDNDNIEELFKDQLTREILLPESNQAATDIDNEEYKGGMWYIGEANFGWIVLNHSQCKHYPVAQTSSTPFTTSSSRTIQGPTKAPSNPLRNHEKRYLESIKAFSLPKSPHLETFLKTFFSQVSPRIPVLSVMSFSTDAVASLTQSPLLIQSMLFASARFLSLDVIHDLGYKDKQDAQNHSYRKAKTLFEFDDEQYLLVKLQSAILLASEWDVFVHEKDPDEWNGKALRIAHRMGLHRSVRSSHINERTRAIYRRIWWTIYKMDRNISIATGRPSTICDHDCDVECLSESDFRSFDDFVDYEPQNQPQSYHQQKSWINYQVRGYDLWKLAGEYTASSYPASQSSILYYREKDYNEALDDWAKQTDGDSQDARGFSSPWTLNLELLYHFVRCLVNRPKNSTHAPSLELPGQAMCNAAWKINQLAEQLVLQHSACPYPYFLPVAMKLSTCVFIVQGATGTSRLTRDFALHRVGSAQLTLEEVIWQIPSAGRVLRTIKNLQGVLEQYQARGMRTPSKSDTEMERSIFTEECSAVAGNKQVLQERAMPESFGQEPFNLPWSNGGHFNFAVFCDPFALDVFDWGTETNFAS